jgi:SH3-like domain-containing protein
LPAPALDPDFRLNGIFRRDTATICSAASHRTPQMAGKGGEAMSPSRRRVIALLAGAALCAGASRANATADGPDFYRVRGVAQWDKLNMRAGPAPSYHVVHRIAHDGRGIENLGRCVARWCQVRHEGAIGWVHSGFLGEDAPDEPRGARYRVVGVAWNDVLNMRAAPTASSAIVGTIPPDAAGIAGTGGCDGAWCRVSYLGLAGWVNTRFLAPQS